MKEKKRKTEELKPVSGALLSLEKQLVVITVPWRNMWMSQEVYAEKNAVTLGL